MLINLFKQAQLKCILNPYQAKYLYSLEQPKAKTCYNCEDIYLKDDPFVCKSCKFLRRPGDYLTKMNIFELFGVPQQFMVDKKKLELRYKSMQMKFHPDKFQAQKADSQKDLSGTYSAHINSSYDIIMSDYQRGMYYLQQVGYKSEEEMEIGLDNQEKFLSQILNIRFEIEEADSSNDLQVLTDGLQDQIQEIGEEIEKDFSVKNYQLAFSNLKELKYYEQCMHAIQTKYDSF